MIYINYNNCYIKVAIEFLKIVFSTFIVMMILLFHNIAERNQGIYNKYHRKLFKNEINAQQLYFE